MAIRAVFIGVDRFADPGIRDLSGCRRDAVALHALFGDGVADIEAEVLVDEEATADRIRSSLNHVLKSASDTDVAIVSFSGHGSRDHRLVVHDTAKSDLVATSIDMAELALRFRESKARVVLCILDCCFSGGAPARVLEDSPTSRDPGLPLEQVGGDGRVLIAASDVNETSLEIGGHGLLTKALLEALQTGEGTISLVTLLDQVMACVRADALRLGSVQTPVMFGHVTGGLSLPTLRKGPLWYAAFPRDQKRTMSGTLDELASCGISQQVIESWRGQIPSGLNGLQLKAVNDHGLLDGRSLLVVAPTSSGKTFIGEMAAAKAAVERKRSVFLFPYKALTNEKYDQFAQTYGATLGQRVIRCTSDTHDQVSEFIRGKYDIALFTYEMFLSVVLSSPWTLGLIGLVVVDEAQFIADPNRGIVVELLLTHVLRMREKGVAPQLIALSAVIGDLHGFDQWLGGEALVTLERPVPLIEGVLDRFGRYRYRDTDGSVKSEQLLPGHSIIQRRDKPSAQDVIVPLVKELLSSRPDERVLIFRNRRAPAEGCAAYLAAALGLPPAVNTLAQLPSNDPSSSSHKLRECLHGGTAFHNSNLIPAERVLVERAFRARDGGIYALTATTTVAAGINTPASTVVLAEHEFLGEDGRPFSVAEYKNMAGRAGRLGFNERGRSIILADEGVSPDFLFQKYVLSEPEPLRSSFSPGDVETWILRLLSQVDAVPIADVAKLLVGTYGGYLASRADPGWHDEMQKRLEELLREMLNLKLLEEARGMVSLTLLGKVCGRSSLSFASTLRLLEMLRVTATPVTTETLLVLVQALPECDATYTPLMKRGVSEERWPREVSATYGANAARALQAHTADVSTYRARCKRAMIIHNWIRGTPIEQVEANATTNPYQGAITAGYVRGFADAARFHLRSAFDIASIALVVDAPSAEAIEEMLCRLEFGIPPSVVPMARERNLGLQRGELLALLRAGVDSLEKLKALSPTDLAIAVGEMRAKQIVVMLQQGTAS